MKLRAALLGLFLLSAAPHAFASSAIAEECEITLNFTQLETKPLPALLDIKGHIVAFAHLWLKPVDPDAPILETDITGLFSKTDPENKSWGSHVIQFLPRQISQRVRADHAKYDLSWITFLDKWIGRFTGKKSGARFRMGMATIAIGATLLDYPLWTPESNLFHWAVNKTHASEFSHGAYEDVSTYITEKAWQEDVHSDYRYAGLRAAYGDAPLDFRAAILARAQKKAYDDMMHFVASEQFPTDFSQRQLYFENSPFFVNIKRFKTYLTGDFVSYGALRPGALAQEQEELIIRSDLDMYLKQDLVGQWVDEKMSSPESFSKRRGAILREIISTPYAKNLLNLHEQGKINRWQVRYFLQENLANQNDWALRDKLGLVQFAFDDTTQKYLYGVPDTTTIAQIQDETTTLLQNKNLYVPGVVEPSKYRVTMIDLKNNKKAP